MRRPAPQPPPPGACRFCGEPENHDGETCYCIRVWYDKARLVVEAPLLPGVLDELRHFNGRQYHGKSLDSGYGVNSFRQQDKPAVWRLLRRFYAGAGGAGAHGSFVVPPLTPGDTRHGWEQWKRERDAGPFAQDHDDQEAQEP